MATVNTCVHDVRLVGGRLCLDFVNTVDSHLKSVPKEYLKCYSDLVVWSVRLHALNQERGDYLIQVAAQRPVEANAIIEHAKSLRSALYRIFSALIHRHKPLDNDLDIVNGALVAAPYRSRILASANGFVWGYADESQALDQPLWQVLWSAVDLLTSAECQLVCQCAGEGCSWLFLDTSRTHSRRWCSMADCGNRFKAQRHYARHYKKL